MNETLPTIVYLPGGFFFVRLPGGTETGQTARQHALFFNFMGVAHVAFSNFYQHEGVYRIRPVPSERRDES